MTLLVLQRLDQCEKKILLTLTVCTGGLRPVNVSWNSSLNMPRPLGLRTSSGLKTLPCQAGLLCQHRRQDALLLVARQARHPRCWKDCPPLQVLCVARLGHHQQQLLLHNSKGRGLFLIRLEVSLLSSMVLLTAVTLLSSSMVLATLMKRLLHKSHSKRLRLMTHQETSLSRP